MVKRRHIAVASLLAAGAIALAQGGAVDAAAPEPQPVEPPEDPLEALVMDGAYGDVVEDLLDAHEAGLAACMATAGHQLLAPDAPLPPGWDDLDAAAYDLALLGDPEDPADSGCAGPAMADHLAAVAELDALIAQNMPPAAARGLASGDELDAWATCMDAEGFPAYEHPDDAGEDATALVKATPDLPTPPEEDLTEAEKDDVVEETAAALEAREAAEAEARVIDAASATCADESGLAEATAAAIDDAVEDIPAPSLAELTEGS